MLGLGVGCVGLGLVGLVGLVGLGGGGDGCVFTNLFLFYYKSCILQLSFYTQLTRQPLLVR